MKPKIRTTVILLAPWFLAGCAAEVTGFRNDKTVTARVATTEAVVDESGRCSATLSIDPAVFRSRTTDQSLIGLTECELVAAKGAPLSVQSGSSPRSKRETTMLYMEPSGKAIYLFADNRLVRVVRAGAQ
jgi:hypothetical protein